MLAAINDHGAETHWLYTDRPIFASSPESPSPPNLAVISAKRLLTGDLTEQEILATLEAYSPEMILSSRFGLPTVEEYMRTAQLPSHRRDHQVPAILPTTAALISFEQGSLIVARLHRQL